MSLHNGFIFNLIFKILFIDFLSFLDLCMLLQKIWKLGFFFKKIFRKDIVHKIKVNHVIIIIIIIERWNLSWLFYIRLQLLNHVSIFQKILEKSGKIIKNILLLEVINLIIFIIIK